MEAIEGFVTDINGERYIVQRGRTRVASSHPLVERYPHMFQAVADNLTFQTEDATDDPGVKRMRAPSGKATVLDQEDSPAPKTRKADA
jgi:hypothetical protein